MSWLSPICAVQDLQTGGFATLSVEALGGVHSFFSDDPIPTPQFFVPDVHTSEFITLNKAISIMIQILLNEVYKRIWWANLGICENVLQIADTM